MIALNSNVRPPVGNSQVIELVLLERVTNLVRVGVSRSVGLLDSDNPAVSRPGQVGRLVHVGGNHQPAERVAVTRIGLEGHQVPTGLAGGLGRTVIGRGSQPVDRQRILLRKPLGQHPVSTGRPGSLIARSVMTEVVGMTREQVAGRVIGELLVEVSRHQRVTSSVPLLVIGFSGLPGHQQRIGISRLEQRLGRSGTVLGVLVATGRLDPTGKHTPKTAHVRHLLPRGEVPGHLGVEFDISGRVGQQPAHRVGGIAVVAR